MFRLLWNDCFFFFFNDTATTEIYTLSLHDALPICKHVGGAALDVFTEEPPKNSPLVGRSEEHTSELQSPCNLVCRLLLEKKKTLPVSLRFTLPMTHRPPFLIDPVARTAS